MKQVAVSYANLTLEQKQRDGGKYLKPIISEWEKNTQRGGWTHPPSQMLPLHRFCLVGNSLSILGPNLDIFQSVIDPRMSRRRSGLPLMYCLFAANPRLCVGKVGRPRPIPGGIFCLR